jgi:hypothetical protein
MIAEDLFLSQRGRLAGSAHFNLSDSVFNVIIPLPFRLWHCRRWPRSAGQEY